MQNTATTNENTDATFYTAHQFAAKVNLSYPTILRLLARKKLKCIPYSRHKRIPSSELARWESGDFI
jgi:excisionase family DNA binding protein